MSLIYANLCKNIQNWPKMTISMQRIANNIQREIYLQVFDIKGSKFANTGKILVKRQLMLLINASSWKNFLKLPEKLVQD